MIPILIALIPQVPALVAAIVALRKAYPQLTPEQIQAIVVEITAQSNTAFDAVLEKIAADEAAHPPTP